MSAKSIPPAQPLHAVPAAPARGVRRFRLRIVLLSASGAVLAGLVAFWLAYHRIPSWYRPPTLDEADFARVRGASTRLVDDVSDRMVRGRSFSMEFGEQEINELLASIGRLWPEALEEWPRALERPVISIEEGRLRAGVTWDRSDDRAVISAEVAIECVEDRGGLRMKIVSIHVGALPVPEFLIGRFAGPMLDRVRKARAKSSSGDGPSPAQETPADVHPWFDPGVEIENRFTWPNGERRFRIVSLEMTPHLLRIEVEPF